MWRAVLRGAGTLARNSNCSYDDLYDIPVSNCSSTNFKLEKLVFQGESWNYKERPRGICQEGNCVCNPAAENGGEWMGRSDWINLDGYSCHFSIESCQTYAMTGLVGSFLVFFQAFRILYKTYMKSKAKERTFKVLLTKRANQVALHAIICWLPIFVLSVVKRVSPRTLLMDPKANPVFFVVILLAGNSEWWCYSLLMNGILGPVLKGIHSLEDKSSIDFVVSIRRLNKNIPVADLIVRVCLAIAALVGAVLDNQNNSTVLSLFFFQCYEHFKYMLFPLLWIRSLLLASSIVSNMTDRSSRTGSTSMMLVDFKKKVKAFVGLIAFGMLVILYWFAVPTLFMSRNYWYRQFINGFMSFRGGVACANSVILELYFLDLWVWCCKIKGDKGMQRTTGNFQRRGNTSSDRSKGARSAEEGCGKVENPMTKLETDDSFL